MDYIEYINKNYPEEKYGEINRNLMDYVCSMWFDEDIDRICENDPTISRDYALECAIEQQADYLIQSNKEK